MSEQGREQARRLGARLADFPFDAAYSSDLCRATETASLVLGEAPRVPLQLDPRLREMHFGEWEGEIVSEIIAQRGDERSEWLKRPDTWHPAGGECLTDVAARVSAAIADIVEAHRSETVLVVGHGFALLSFIAQAIGLPLASFRHLWLDPTGVNEIHVGSQRTTLRRLNDTAHLDPDGA